MPSAKRRIDSGVAQQLLAHPHRFQFFQAIRLLEQVFQRQGARANQSVATKIRFHNTLSLGFPVAELDPSVQVYSPNGEQLKGDALESALHSDLEAIGEVHLTPQFMGLLGITGALPLHYTETLQEREIYLRDRTARAFLDIFSNRAVALHYTAWKKHKLALQYELDRRERFMPLILSLLGMGMTGLRERMVNVRGEIFDQAVAYYAGAIRQRPVSVSTLKRLLADYFRVPVRVEQFVGAWYKVPDSQVTRLGIGNATLGASALAGDRVWQRDLRLRLAIGPLRRNEFDALLPGGDAAEALSNWLSLLIGGGLEYEVRLVLHAEDIRQAGIGHGHSARLGWDGYLATRQGNEHRTDASYGIHTLQ
jgi:type VI secretion system protein ImpH